MPSTSTMVFTLVGRDHLSRAFRQAGLSAGRLKKDLTGLGAAAAIPVGASAVSTTLALAGAFGSAGVAVAAFGIAVAPQAKRIGEVSKAQKKYAEAVAESGKSSEEAAKAERAYLASVHGLPPETRKAAAAFLVLKDSYKQWSDSTADDTMPVLTKSFGVFSALLPKLNPLVRGTSKELDRLMTVVAGGVASQGFERMTKQFAVFSSSVLSSAIDGLVHFSRVLQGFDPSGGALGAFLDYARENGPLVGETLKNLARAAATLLESGAGLGVAMLQLANSLASVVASLPPGFVSTVLQLYAAFKLASLAAAGLGAATLLVQTLTRRLVVLRAAAVGTGGALAGLRAAFFALSVAARTAVVAAAIAVLVVGLSKLASIGREAPPNIDKLTMSLGRLGRTGKVSGEAAKAFGKDLGELYNELRSFTDPSVVDNIQQGLVKVFTLGMADSTPVKDAKKNLDAIDEALTNLVKGGKADLAAAALTRLKKAYAGKDKHAVKEFTNQLDGYKSALADARFEAQLTADAQGLFGQQALKTAEKLNAQKQSADGLRGAIQALNDVQRQGLGGMIGFEAAIDAAAKGAKKYADSLSMSGGQLNLNSEKARNAASLLADLGQKTDEAAASARESGASWATVNGIYDRGRSKLIRFAHAMGLSEGQAKQLADQILKIPDKTAKVKMDREDALTGLRQVQAAIKKTPGAKKITVSTLSAQAIAALHAVGLKTKRLPDGRVVVTARNGQAIGSINAVVRAMNNLDGKVSTTYIRTIYNSQFRAALRKQGATGGLYTGRGFRRGYAGGGLVDGPGTETSDDVFAGPWLSKNEYVNRAASVRKYGVKVFDAFNNLRVPVKAAQALTSPGASAPARAGNTVTNHYTYHLTQRDMTVGDLEMLQRRQEAYQRIGRPR